MILCFYNAPTDANLELSNVLMCHGLWQEHAQTCTGGRGKRTKHDHLCSLWERRKSLVAVHVMFGCEGMTNDKENLRSAVSHERRPQIDQLTVEGSQSFRI